MVKRRIGMLLLAVCVCLGLLPRNAQAVTIEEAQEPIEPERVCALTVSYCYDGVAFSDVPVKLYKIADVSPDCEFTLTASFADSALILNGIRSAGEWDVIRTTLEAYILAQDIQADVVAVTDGNGQAQFAALETGMYLAVAGEATQGNLRCDFASALVALPGLGVDAHWQYQVEVNAKGEALPPIEPDEELELSVLKLWKGDEGQNDRPESVEIEIFRDGVSYETVILSEENHWSYRWTAKDDGASWQVVERNIPEGYTMTIEERNTSFIVTNTRDTNEPPVDPPDTGDRFDLLPFILLLGISGSVMIMLGMTRKRNEE